MVRRSRGARSIEAELKPLNRERRSLMLTLKAHPPPLSNVCSRLLLKAAEEQRHPLNQRRPAEPLRFRPGHPGGRRRPGWKPGPRRREQRRRGIERKEHLLQLRTRRLQQHQEPFPLSSAPQAGGLGACRASISRPSCSALACCSLQESPGAQCARVVGLV